MPANALDAHLQMADIPIIDTAGLAILGNDDFLLRLLRAKAGQNQINDYVAWTLHATKCLGLKVINAGGANAFKASDCKKLFEALLKQKVVTLSNNKIIYDLELLHKVN